MVDAAQYMSSVVVVFVCRGWSCTFKMLRNIPWAQRELLGYTWRNSTVFYKWGDLLFLPLCCVTEVICFVYWFVLFVFDTHWAVPFLSLHQPPSHPPRPTLLDFTLPYLLPHLSLPTLSHSSHSLSLHTWHYVGIPPSLLSPSSSSSSSPQGSYSPKGACIHCPEAGDPTTGAGKTRYHWSWWVGR